MRRLVVLLTLAFCLGTPGFCLAFPTADQTPSPREVLMVLARHLAIPWFPCRSEHEPVWLLEFVPAARGERRVDLQAALQTVRTRLDRLGTEVHSLYSTGTSIAVLVPHRDEVGAAALAESLVIRTTLAFQRVLQGDVQRLALEAIPAWHEQRSEASTVRFEDDYHEPRVVAEDRQELQAFADWLASQAPALAEVRCAIEKVRTGYPEAEKHVSYRLYLLEATPWLTEADVASAQPGTDPYGHPHVMLQFTAAGGARFAELTEQYVDHKLAIVVNGEVSSAPVIRERIAGGRAQITLGTNPSLAAALAEANALARTLSLGTAGIPLSLARAPQLLSPPPFRRLDGICWGQTLTINIFCPPLVFLWRCQP